MSVVVTGAEDTRSALYWSTVLDAEAAALLVATNESVSRAFSLTAALAPLTSSFVNLPPAFTISSRALLTLLTPAPTADRVA